MFVGNTMWSMFRFRENILSRLVKDGYRVYVVAGQDEFQKDLRAIGCEVIPLNIRRQGVNPFPDALTLYQLWRIYKKIKPNIIFHYTIKPNIYGSISAFFCSLPCISVVTGSGRAFLKRNVLFYIIKIMYRIAFLHPEKIWFLNPEDQNEFLALSIVTAEKATPLSGEGVDLEHYKPASKKTLASSAASLLKRAKYRFDFLFVGRLIREKGIYEYIEAAKKLQEKYRSTSFGILGPFDPESKSSLQKKDLSRQIENTNISYLGEKKDIKGFLEESSCVVLPSYYREGIPRVLLEASAMCKPMLATDHVGCRQIVEDGQNGYLCKPKDSYDLAMQMEKMLRLSPKERDRMGRQARKKVQEGFSDKIVVEKYMNTINGILHRAL